MKKLRSRDRGWMALLWWTRLLGCVALLCAVVPALPAASEEEEALLELTLDQNLGEQVPPGLVFTDSEGVDHRLGDYFGERPMILILGYYDCPMLCSLVLNGTSSALAALPFEPGKDFDVIFVSIDPEEDTRLAAANKRAFVKHYDKPGAEDGIHFMTGSEANIRELARVVGFKFRQDPDSGEFAHPSGIMILTPEGKLSKYFYGIEYKPRALRLALVEASDGGVGNPVDQLLLLCSHYNPVTGEYGWLIDRVIKLAAGVTVLLLGLLIGGYLWRERRQRRKAAANEEKKETLTHR